MKRSHTKILLLLFTICFISAGLTLSPFGGSGTTVFAAPDGGTQAGQGRDQDKSGDDAGQQAKQDKAKSDDKAKSGDKAKSDDKA